MAKEGAPGSLMSPAEMKPLLLLSKRDPVSTVIGANPDPGAHARLVQEAQQVIAQYETYIAGEVLLSQLDRNPSTPLAVQKTLTVSRAALAKVVH